MDPGTAIGLAGTAYRLVVAAIDFVDDAKQVHGKGGTDVNRDLDAVAKAIQSASTSLEAQLAAAVGGKDDEEENRTQLDPEDEALRDLAVKASEIGKELELELQKVLVQDKSMFKTFRTVIRGMWAADDIKKIQFRLSKIQDQLNSRILVEIKRKVDHSENEYHEETFKALERVARHQSESHKDNQVMIGSLARIEEMQANQSQEMQRIMQEMREVSIPSSPMPYVQAHPVMDDVAAKRKAVEAILSSLWYSSMHDREEGISEAHRKTMDWIFQDPKETSKPWDSFIGFLRGDDDVYWITGKPGSGKSTVMKYIQQDPRTNENLAVWASGREIIPASFYFFYNGADMQKTELGLLMSLLRTVLRQHPELIPSAFGDKFTAAYRGFDILSTPVSVYEARKALKDLIRANGGTCFFFSIDGLDEFDPEISSSDVSSLLDLTDILRKFTNVKLLLSSRPLTAFEQKFSKGLSLRMHELTREDIRLFVHERLMEHQRMQYLFSEDEGNSTHFVDSIVENSSGVFLWVRLVVSSLLEGLSNYDNLDELRSRVEELPTDLHDLYRVMLSRVDPKYRKQSAKLLRLTFTCVGGGAELSALGLWFASQDAELVSRTPLLPIDDVQLKNHVQEIDRRLKNCCRGLIELTPFESNNNHISSLTKEPRGDIYDASDKHLSLKVAWIHRSVFEFLSKPDVENEFFNTSTLSRIQARLCLLRSALLVLKTCRLNQKTEWSVFLKLAYNVGITAFEKEVDDGHAEPQLILMLDEVMSQHLLKAKKLTSASASDLPWTKYPNAHWSLGYDLASKNLDRREIIDHDKNFVAFAATCGLTKFLKFQAEQDVNALEKRGLPLLGYALCHRWPWNTGPGPGYMFNVTKYLVEHGGNTNEIFKGERFVRLLDSKMMRFSYVGLQKILNGAGWIPHLANVKTMELLIPFGVEVNARLVFEEEKNSNDGSDKPYLLRSEFTLLEGVDRGLATYSEPGVAESLKKLGHVDLELLWTVREMLVERGAVAQTWIIGRFDKDGNRLPDADGEEEKSAAEAGSTTAPVLKDRNEEADNDNKEAGSESISVANGGETEPPKTVVQTESEYLPQKDGAMAKEAGTFEAAAPALQAGDALRAKPRASRFGEKMGALRRSLFGQRKNKMSSRAR
ncbi:uncharacterized protein JN550_009930 [Neoarthrinium moseri]|uniref:uncharacterized protein n=1 Tax=Neoarthrinium moseri TaxID=1658444 RepID=UPI001FDBEEA2|nr:uncharacterized protein JN550_009930 [Neoarthrinium moseri]KAI1862783.1 hypothetical protein JN550_009930 [Neoarthrinium moseri]